MRNRPLRRHLRFIAASGVALLATGCGGDGPSAPEERAYTSADFPSVPKFDAHVHVNNDDPAALLQARADGFDLLSINVDTADFPSLEVQEQVALADAAADPVHFHFATTFSMNGWDDPSWASGVNTRLTNAVGRGAVAVKVWKNVGMAARDARGHLIMVDDPRLDPVFAHVASLGVPLIGHQGEPRDCWLPLGQMRSQSNRGYFGTHPQYYMFLHPEMPSYEDQMRARDNRLARTPAVRFVGAHLASLEWSVDRLAAFLDEHPQASVDLARMSQVQFQSRLEYAKVRSFFVHYQDRVLYGTDINFAPGEDPSAFRDKSHRIWMSDWLYLATSETQRVADIDADVIGLHLPRSVIDKIYWTNARRTFLATEAR